MTTEEKIELIEEVFDCDEGSLTGDTILEDLEDWDSLSALGLMVMAKEKFSLNMTGDVLKGFVTVQDICDFLK